MASQTYENVHGPLVVQHVGGDLRIRGRLGARVSAEGDGVEVERPSEDAPLLVRSSGDLRLSVPQGLELRVQAVSGDAKLTEVDGVVHVQRVDGDLVVRQARRVTVQAVGADLRLKGVREDVEVQTVGGDATVREVGGAVHVHAVGDDLYLRHVGGHCVVERVGDDLVLSVDFVAGKTYRFHTSGDILCRVREDASVRFILPLETELQLDVQAEVSTEETAHQTVTLGQGEAEVHILAAETVRLVGEAEDYMLNFGVQLEEELEARLSWLEEKLNRQLEGLDVHFQRQAERWGAQAERWVGRVFGGWGSGARSPKQKRRPPGPRRMRFTASFGRAPRPGPPPPPPPKEPVTDKERRMILQMVRDGHITVEEAEHLLAALEE